MPNRVEGWCLKMITLRPLKAFRFPVTAECISPDVFHAKTLDEIRRFLVWEGNKQRRLDELFEVEFGSDGSNEKTVIAIHGDVSRVARIGCGMSAGKILIVGDVGSHLGEGMKGGAIMVQGKVGGWAGSTMKGGSIEIEGDAGDYLAAPYRGSSEGMGGGQIIIRGNVGNEAGEHMKSGLIKICGNAAQFVGFRMRDGTIYVQKNCQERAGACMTGGKIIIGQHVESVLPTFTIEGIKEKVKVEGTETVDGPFYVFQGDSAENGEGKLYVSKDSNEHLSSYERFL